MLNKKNDTYEDNFDFLSSEFSSIPNESFQRQRPPFSQGPGQNNPPIGNPPPGFNFPGGGGFNPPEFNYPEGGFNQPGMPKSPPPNYIPDKNGMGVQSFSQSQYGPAPMAVSPNSIRFCLYKYTYIWEVTGRSYWAFLLNVDRRSVSGFRWFRRRWVYFGVDLRRIDSFVCYSRSSLVNTCDSCNSLRQDDISLLSSKKEFSLNETRDVYTQTLASVDIPEIKEDSLTQTIGAVDNINVASEIPCLKSRSIGYKITLEVTYPSSYDRILKNSINEAASEASNDAYKIISSTRGNDGSSNPLEVFNSSLLLIPDALKTFSDSFNSKLQRLNLSEADSNNIIYSIRKEKIHADWKPYFYNNPLFN